MSRYRGITNPLNLSPPSSDDENRAVRKAARHRARKASQQASSNAEVRVGGLRRRSAINSARQSSSRRASAHSTNNAFYSQSNAHPESEKDHEQTRGVRHQTSTAFEPECGVDLSSLDNSYGSYGQTSSNREAGALHKGSAQRQSPHRRLHGHREPSESHDLSSMAGMPEDIYQDGQRQHRNKRRQGQYYGATEDRSSARGSSKAAIPNRFASGDSDSDSY